MGSDFTCNLMDDLSFCNPFLMINNVIYGHHHMIHEASYKGQNLSLQTRRWSSDQVLQVGGADGVSFNYSHASTKYGSRHYIAKARLEECRTVKAINTAIQGNTIV